MATKKTTKKKEDKYGPDFEHCPACGSPRITVGGMKVDTNNNVYDGIRNFLIDGVNFEEEGENPEVFTLSRKCECKEEGCGMVWYQVFTAELKAVNFKKRRNEFDC